MENVVLVIHLILALSIIGLVLLQRSEGGGLGIGGGGGMGKLAGPQGTANIMTRATAICGFAFFCTSLLLGILAGTHSNSNQSILDSLATETQTGQEDTEAAGTIKIDQDGSISTAPSAPVAE